MEDPNTKVTTPAPTSLEASIIAASLGKVMNKWLFLTVTVICVFVFGICWLIADIEKRSTRPGEFIGTIAGFFSPQDRPRHVIARNYKFWTPGEDTAAAVANITLSPEKRAWYSLDGGDDTLKKFGDDLVSLLGAQGYSRYKGVGQGTGPIKPGWTWEMTVPTGSEKFTMETFLKLYQSYFKRDRDVYVEITDIGTETHRSLVKDNK